MKNWDSVLKYALPIMLFVLGVYIRQVDSSINLVRSELKDYKMYTCETMKEYSDKMFKHMTNDEMHAPRSMVITKPEFAIYQELRNDQMKELREGMLRIQALLERHAENDK